MRKLSIIIPAYNEARYIGPLIEKILSVDTESLGFEKELIVVDDGSSDDTLAIAGRYAAVKCFKQPFNQGKGSAVQRGIREAGGEYFLVQDADLEYDPGDYIPMLDMLGAGDKLAVYGSRTLHAYDKGVIRGLIGSRHEKQGLGPWLANVALTLWTMLLYGRFITDTLTAYKLYPASAFKQFSVVTAGFETDHEITAKLIRRGISIVEVPIHYTPRSKAEGKKINALDGLKAIWTLLRFRF